MDHELPRQQKFEKWTRAQIEQIQAVVAQMATAFDKRLNELDNGTRAVDQLRE